MQKVRAKGDEGSWSRGRCKGRCEGRVAGRRMRWIIDERLSRDDGLDGTW